MHRLAAERTLKTIRNYEMVRPGDSVLAAVSGGPDSVFLLCMLDRLKKKLGMKKLAVCNLDHGLRPGQSRADSVFVKNLCKKMDVEFIHKRINLNKIRAKKNSIEEAAREERYKFFREAAERSGANVIVTGHTLDDQAETILMRVIKGASLKGLVGISPVRADGVLRIIRPLMEFDKADIVRYLEDAGIPYRIDSTNADPVYFRNIVRSRIIPFLERYNPRLKRSLFNLSEHLREDFKFIEEARGKALCLPFPDGAGRIEVRLKDLVLQPTALQKEILRDCLEKAGGEVKKLSFRHWKELERLIKHKGKGSSIDLPGSIRATRTTGEVVFRRI